MCVMFFYYYSFISFQLFDCHLTANKTSTIFFLFSNTFFFLFIINTTSILFSIQIFFFFPYILWFFFIFLKLVQKQLFYHVACSFLVNIMPSSPSLLPPFLIYIFISIFSTVSYSFAPQRLAWQAIFVPGNTWMPFLNLAKNLWTNFTL